MESESTITHDLSQLGAIAGNETFLSEKTVEYVVVKDSLGRSYATGKRKNVVPFTAAVYIISQASARMTTSSVDDTRKILHRHLTHRLSTATIAAAMLQRAGVMEHGNVGSKTVLKQDPGCVHAVTVVLSIIHVSDRGSLS